MNIRESLKVISSPNYYHGDSVLKLLIHNIISTIGYFKRRGPSKELMAPTKKLKNSKKGYKALVLGSGPSLGKLNLAAAELKDYEIFAVNTFYQSPAAANLCPKFYCLSDPNFFIENRTNSTHKDSELIEYFKQTEVTLLISHFYRKSNKFKSFQKIYFNDKELRWGRQSVSPIRARSYVSATLYKALAMACYMGYEEICILGMDNNEFAYYVSNEHNQVFVDFKKYFATGLSSEVQFGEQEPEGFTSGMAGRLQYFGIIFGDLYKFRKYPIINLDQESLIDTFPKISNHPLVR